jgi:hypothetical protein
VNGAAGQAASTLSVRVEGRGIGPDGRDRRNPEPVPGVEYLPTAHAAEELLVSTTIVAAMMLDGALPALRLPKD